MQPSSRCGGTSRPEGTGPSPCKANAGSNTNREFSAWEFRPLLPPVWCTSSRSTPRAVTRARLAGRPRTAPPRTLRVALPCRHGRCRDEGITAVASHAALPGRSSRSQHPDAKTPGPSQPRRMPSTVRPLRKRSEHTVAICDGVSAKRRRRAQPRTRSAFVAGPRRTGRKREPTCPAWRRENSRHCGTALASPSLTETPLRRITCAKGIANSTRTPIRSRTPFDLDHPCAQ